MLRYEVFICYKQNTGKDYALHLWEGLREFNHTPFLDIKDIPTKFSEGTQKWRELRDYAIKNCEVFLMIVTQGFESSPEIQTEIKLALEQHRELMCLIHRYLPKNITVESLINLGEYQQIPFETPQELLREVLHNLGLQKAIAVTSPIQQPIQTEEIHILPLVNFHITQAIGNNTALKRKLPNVGFNIRNLSDFPVRARIRARVFLGGKDLGLVKGETRGGKYMGYYDGKVTWNLNPYILIFGNFNIPEESTKTDETLRINVSVTLLGPTGKKSVLLPVGFTFMRDKDEWFLEPTENI